MTQISEDHLWVRFQTGNLSGSLTEWNFVPWFGAVKKSQRLSSKVNFAMVTGTALCWVKGILYLFVISFIIPVLECFYNFYFVLAEYCIYMQHL